jgi:hypothetical protein
MHVSHDRYLFVLCRYLCKSFVEYFTKACKALSHALSCSSACYISIYSIINYVHINRVWFTSWENVPDQPLRIMHDTGPDFHCITYTVYREVTYMRYTFLLQPSIIPIGLHDKIYEKPRLEAQQPIFDTALTGLIRSYLTV